MEENELGSGCGVLLFLGLCMSSGLTLGGIAAFGLLFFGLVGLAQSPEWGVSDPKEALLSVAWVIILAIAVGVIFA